MVRDGAPERYLIAPVRADGTVAEMTLGELLRAAIDRKNKSHAWVAQEVGITPASLSAILTGKTADPSFFTVLAIARTIEEPISAIVDDPLHYWTAEELEELRTFGQWLEKRATRERAGKALAIPPRKKWGGTFRVHPVAATPDLVLYPDAFELPKKRIAAKYARMNADAVFSVSGESMTGADIRPGDLLYVHRTRAVEEAVGRIVVCAVDDMILVKRLRTRAGSLLLESANPAFPPMRIDEDAVRFELIGVVVAKDRK